MHRSLSTALAAAALSVCQLAAAPPTSDAPLEQARRSLERNDAAAAVELLEANLAGSLPADRPALLQLLRRAYQAAAQQAQAAGRPLDAEAYRENLQILDRKLAPKAPAPADDPAVTRVSATQILPEPKIPQDRQAQTPPVAKPGPGPATEPLTPLPEAAAAPARLPSPAPVADAAVPPAPPAGPSGPGGATAIDRLATADEAFRGGRYAEAGKVYGELYQAKRLPRSRQDHWAYCRCVAVVDRINAQPGSPREWAEINAEIASIQALSPKQWYAEYLRNVVTERTPKSNAARSKKVIVRGAAPEEDPFPPLTAADMPHGAATPPRDPDVRQAAAEASAPARTVAIRRAPNIGNWLVLETPNFRLLYADHELAEKVAQAAEQARSAQCKRWKGEVPGGDWTPRCDIYLYPTAQIFSRMTGQPEDSPGFSTMGMNAGRITARRINLRADHPNLVGAILPHEVTHVVLADLFPFQQIPRWADEGMAVLSEPPGEQRLRVADLDKPLASGELFRIADLMVMDYPDGRFWALYYAQCVSLTRFLVELGTPAQFIEFVQGAQRRGHEAELRRIYKINGFDELHKRWVDYARTQSSSEPTAMRDPERSTSSARR